MKRLLETEGGSPLLQRTKALLEATPPLPESRERMLRVRRELDAPRGLWVQLRRLPAAAAAALIVLFGASAFAAVRVVYEAVQGTADEAPQMKVERRYAARDARPQAEPAPVAAPAPAPPASLPAPLPASLPASPAEAPLADEATEGSEPDDGAAQHARGTLREPRHAASARRTPSARAAAREAASDASLRGTDSELVHRAAKALRSDHNPALAARLLEAHRARHPSGPLAEEALSLHIEALSALRSPRAKTLARQYLARHPGGRYSAVAARALADSAP